MWRPSLSRRAAPCWAAAGAPETFIKRAVAALLRGQGVLNPRTVELTDGHIHCQAMCLWSITWGHMFKRWSGTLETSRQLVRLCQQ